MACGCNCGLKIAKGILVLINVFLLIIGIVFSAVAGYALAMGGHFTTIVPKAAMTMGLAAGVCLIIFSFMGCCASWTHNRFLLFLYSFCVLVIIIVEIVAGVAVANFLGALKTISVAQNPTAAAQLTAADMAIVQAMNSTYTYCCIQNPQLVACSSFLNITGNMGCVQGAGLPPMNGVSGFNQFKINLEAFARSHFKPIGDAFAVLGAIELLALVSACHLVFHKERQDFDESKGLTGSQMAGVDGSYQSKPRV
jgi:hypothetical protein